MKTLVLDTTELRRDWLFQGVTSQLLGYAVSQTILNVCIPASAIEELVAHHGRATDAAVRDAERTRNEWRRLGMGHVEVKPTALDYRDHLMERFDESLAFSVLPWPEATHQELVGRAVSRTPPFDEKGGGYRDSLVWASVVELAQSNHDVVLVSADNAFRDKDGTLNAELLAEIEGLPGSVELVRDLVPWLLRNLPWRASNIAEAVGRARDDEFYRYFLQSDFQDDIVPQASDIGFERAPYKFEIVEVEWNGALDRIGTREGIGGVLLAEYDIGETVHFEAELPESTLVEQGWEVTSDGGGRRNLHGSVDLVARLAVLFDEKLGMSFEDLSWRRADGMPPGPGVLPSFDGPPLF